MKTSISVGIALTAFVGMAADYQTLSSVCDLGEFTPTATKGVYFQANTTNESYTLSQDADFSSLELYVNSGSASFDFSGGNHTMRLKTFYAANENAPWIIMKGGVWNVASTFTFSRFTDSNGRTIVMDSCVVTNAEFINGPQGANNRLLLKNGSVMHGKWLRMTFPGAVATTFRTNNLISVSGGSSILWGSNGFLVDSGGSTDGLTGTLLEFTGGSIAKGTSNSSKFVLGGTTSGNAAHFCGGSLLYVPREFIIGDASNAKYNVLTVEGGSAVTNGYDIYIGNVDGADYNRFELIDSELYGGEYNGIYVGYQGSFNELVVSNSAIKRCYFCCAGYTASSSNNTVRIIGERASIGGSKYDMKLFGRGPNNMYILDGCSIGSQSKACYFAYVSSSVTDVAAVGDTLSLVNGAELSESSMNMNTNCRNNVIYVGAGSSIKTKSDFAIRGRDNRVVVSNGTLYVSQSGSSLRFGKSTSDVDEAGNTLVFQGSSPKVARIDPDNNYPAQFYNGSVLKFEIPAEGYSDVVFERTAVEMRGTAALEFGGIEECSRAIPSSRDFQLTSSPFRKYNSEGVDVTSTYLEEVTETLPEHCRVYRDASNNLWLHVACIRGFRMILR